MKTRKSVRVKRPRSGCFLEIERRLRSTYGRPRHHNPLDPLDDLVFLVLSRMTQEWKYLPTYQSLRRELPLWSSVRDAPEDYLADLLRYAGLALTKARQLQGILREVEAREGALDLSRLRALPDADIEAYLISLPGVARKTARCVMLYSLGRDACPVDTHVWRVMKRLGLAPNEKWSERASQRLEESIPHGIRGSLHVTLLSHGRAICRARSPRCGECVLKSICPSAQ